MTELVRGFWVIGYREMLRLTAQRTRLISSIATPLLFFALFGAGFNRLIGPMGPGLDFVTFMYPGVVAMTAIMPAAFAGMSVVWDREFGFLREVLVAPLSRAGIVLGKVGGGAAVATLEALVLIALAPLLGVGLGAAQLLVLIPLLLLLSAAVSCLGILIGSHLRSQEAFQAVMALLILPLIFLSGVFFPVEAVPDWLAALVKVNPVTYGVDAVRQVMLFGHGSGIAGAPTGPPELGVALFGRTLGLAEEMLILTGLAAALFAAAVHAFTRSD